MNGSFENIFEKYNIHCDVGKKRRKNKKPCTQALTLHKQDFSSVLPKTPLISSSIPDIHSKYTCHYNNKTKNKYYIPTRYKTLEVIGVKNSYEHHNLICNVSKTNSKENVNLQASSSLNIKKNNAICSQTNVTRSSLNNCKRYLSESLSITRSNTRNLEYQQLNAGSFKKRNCLSVNESSNISILPMQPVESSCTELDLLIDLIQQQEKNSHIEHKKKSNFRSYDNNLSCTKSCLKGGYQELFEKALKGEKVKSNFLKYDKKVGLRAGQLLSVVKLETSYGLTLATVKSKDLNRNFVITVSQEMAPRLKLGTQVEAFFEENTQPYKLQLNDTFTDVYLEPYKLLIV